MPAKKDDKKESPRQRDFMVAFWCRNREEHRRIVRRAKELGHVRDGKANKSAYVRSLIERDLAGGKSS